MAARPQVDIVIVNFNGGKFIEECIEAVKQQTLSSFHVYLIDNHSTDGSAALLHQDDERFTIVHNKENVGFAAACNQGAALGSAEWIAMLNPDTVPAIDWLEQAIHCANQHNATMVGCTQISKLQPELLDGVGDAFSIFGLAWRGGFGWPVENAPENDGFVFGPCAAAAFYERMLFVKSGGFDESYFCYVEDVDLAFRLRLFGGVCVHSSRSIVAHVGSGISGRRSEFTIYHGTRNRIWTWFKNIPFILLWAATPLMVLANVAFLGRSVFHGTFNCTFRASADAVRGLPSVFEARREIQARKVIGSFEILRAMTLSPIKLIRRAPDVRPVQKNTKRGLRD
ncbi:MAG: glycosyl transferase [Hyphobacterium sp.]|nr:MAG: glycosyl transferase [Hyphobacterium sp.]